MARKRKRPNVTRGSINGTLATNFRVGKGLVLTLEDGRVITLLFKRNDKKKDYLTIEASRTIKFLRISQTPPTLSLPSSEPSGIVELTRSTPKSPRPGDAVTSPLSGRLQRLRLVTEDTDSSDSKTA